MDQPVERPDLEIAKEALNYAEIMHTRLRVEEDAWSKLADAYAEVKQVTMAAKFRTRRDILRKLIQETRVELDALNSKLK